MTATQIITRALGLADLRNTSYITWNDQANSLFETYRDIYSTLIDADDDYFLIDTVIDLIPAMVDPISGSITKEWLVPMPSDCMRIRWVYYNNGTTWQPMTKFAIYDMYLASGPPQYRWENQNLHIVGNSSWGFNQVRIGYYPQQPVATVPDIDYVYGDDIALSDRPKVSWPCYSDQAESLLYIYDGTKIQIDSKTLDTSATVLYTATSTVTYLDYYAGYVYWLRENAIYRAPYLQTGTLVPEAVNSDHTYTSFSVSPSDQMIYASDGTNIYSMELDGTGISTYQSFAGTDVYPYGGLFGIYVDGSGNLKTTDGTTLATDVGQASTDGSHFIFYLTTDGVLYSATYDAITDALANQSVLRSRISIMGPFFSSGDVYPGSTPAVMTGRIPVVNYSLDLLAISSVVDYDFAYPLNEANEIMAYQCAVDFCRKANRDFSMLQGRLGVKGKETQNGIASGIWGRLERSLVRRDDYLPERIGNLYWRGGMGR